jgi:hypothetical protein
MTKPTQFTAGGKIGEWTLIACRPSLTENGKTVRAHAWKCQCSCGVIRWVRTCNLRAGQSSSCGHDSPNSNKTRHAHLNLRPVSSVFQLGQ